MALIRTIDLFDLNCTIASDLFEGKEQPWEVLGEIKEYILNRGEALCESDYDRPRNDIWIARDAKVASSACLNGPLIVDSRAEIRHGAYVRGGVVVGKDAVVGNSTELKNCILFDGVQVPHFNYVGDSILGAYAHFGAGVITSNVRCDRKNVVIHVGEGVYTGLRKLGAMVGDRAEVGCNSVLNPGTMIGRNAMVYPLSSVRGVVEENSIFKAAGVIVRRREV